MVSASRFSKINVPSAYQLVAEAIEREILSGRLMPGDEIGTETQLSEQFGVNRSTTREGIRLLEQSGLVERQAGRKLHVCLPRYQNLTTRISRAMILHQVTFREIYEVTLVLEVACAESAAEHRTDDDIAKLEEIHARTRAAVNNPSLIAQCEEEFDAEMARATHNRALELAREPSSFLFQPTTEIICRHVPEGGARIAEAHRHVLDAIIAQDKEKARLWTRRHVNDWRKGFERTGQDIDQPVRWVPESANQGDFF